jgi:uncharacterized protein
MKFTIKILTILIGAICLGTIAAAQGANHLSGHSSSWKSQDVSFNGLNVKLSGTLMTPGLAAGSRSPGVLIIVGSRESGRDGLVLNGANQPIYRDLAEALAKQGIASLRYDKRCIGSSECRKAESFDDYIDDAKGALEFLRKQPQIDPKRIFLFGHSEGGVIASTIGASDEGGLAGVILAASAGRTMTKIWRDQAQLQLKEAGKKPDETDAALAKYDRVLRGLSSGQTTFPNEKFDARDPIDAILLELISQNKIVVSLLINDPLQIAANIKSPVLILQGKNDRQIAVKDALYIEEALKRVNHPDTNLQLLDGVDHLFKAGAQGDSRPLDGRMLAILTGWVQQRAK